MVSGVVSGCLRPPASCYAPYVFRVAYGIQPLLDSGIDGRGETVTVLAPAPPASFPGAQTPGRAAIPAARAALAAFDGLHLTYTPAGPVLDHLTSTQRTILAHLNIPLPWPEKRT